MAKALWNLHQEEQSWQGRWLENEDGSPRAAIDRKSVATKR